MFDARRRPSPRRAALLRAAVSVALAAAGGCDARSARPAASAPRDEKVEFAAAQPAPARAASPSPFAPVPTSAATDAVTDEADFAGRGVAGGGAAATAAGRRAPPSPAFKKAGAGQVGAAAGVAADAAMLIRTGTAAVEVDSLEPAVAQMRALAQRVGGYVANTALAAGREQVRSATLELRVPAPRFDEVVGGLAPFGRVERVDVRAEDVGEEFVDVTARVANARRLEARLVELLARRTGRLQEVLSVERELARVREEVERYEGRLRYLRTRAATSTLSVTLHEPPPLLVARPNATPVADAFQAAGRNFVALLAAVIAASGVWVPIGALAYAAWRWRRRRDAEVVTRRRTPPAPSAA